MAIPTELSLQGFIATAPEISVGPKGRTRFYCRVGIKQRRKEVDGSFTKLDPVYCDLVLFGHAAERAYPGVQAGRPVRRVRVYPRVRAGPQRRSRPGP